MPFSEELGPRSAFGNGYWLPVLSAEDKERKWTALETSFYRFTSADALASMSFEELYRSAYELVSKGHGDFVHERLKKCLSHLCQQAVEDLRRVPETEQAEFVHRFSHAYEAYKQAVNNIADVLLYLDKNYHQPRNLPSVKAQAGLQFRLEVFESSLVGSRVSSTLSHFVELLRDCLLPFEGPSAASSTTLHQEVMGRITGARSQVPEPELRKLTLSTLVLESPEQKFIFYKKAIQEPLSQSSLAYFRREQALLAEMSGTHILNAIYTRLIAEPQILKICGVLETATINHQLQLIVAEYVDTLHPTLFSTPELDLALLFRQSETLRPNDPGSSASDLCVAASSSARSSTKSELAQRLYAVVRGSSRAAGIFVSRLQALLEAELRSLMQTPSAITAVEHVTSLRRRYAEFVRENFDNASDLLQLMSRALRNVSIAHPLLCRKLAGSINEHLLALECRRIGLQEGSPAEQISSFIREHVLEPFRALQDHDMFEFAYRNQLIVRFLDVMARWFVDGDVETWGEAAIALENEALKPFVEECGQFYIKKIRGFFDDIEISQDFGHLYETQRAAEAKGDAGLRVIVVSLKQWMQELRQTPSFSFTHVPDLLACKETFERHYQSHFAHRKLRWLLEHGKGLLRFHVAKEHCAHVDVVASTVQTAILLLFNDHPSLSWTQICELLDVDLDTSLARRHWIGLWAKEETAFLAPTTAKLKKARLAQDDAQLFSVNADFVSAKKRLTAAVVSVKAKALRSDARESEELLEHPLEDADLPLTASGLPYSLEQDRKAIVEAAIVRVLKANRSMSHAALVSALNTNLVKRGFLPSPAFVKDRIEELMSRDFVARDVNDHKMYHYIS